MEFPLSRGTLKTGFQVGTVSLYLVFWLCGAVLYCLVVSYLQTSFLMCLSVSVWCRLLVFETCTYVTVKKRLLARFLVFAVPIHSKMSKTCLWLSYVVRIHCFWRWSLWFPFVSNEVEKNNNKKLSTEK